VELRQLRHFLALVEERSVTRAAKRELIVQSGLSNSLQALERELGTPASAVQAEQAVHHTRDALIGALRLGVSLSAQHLVPFAAYLGEFTRDHPGIDLRLQYAPALTMISMLEAGELDCVIGPAVSQVAGVRMTRLAREPLHLLCRADHPLAERAEVNLRQLAGERFVEVPAGWTARLLSDAAFPVLTAPNSVLRFIAVEGVRLERHIYLMLPSVGETSPAARRFADQLLRIHPAAGVTGAAAGP
jgi:DNA-binding transcriptional LysR family regulator